MKCWVCFGVPTRSRHHFTWCPLPPASEPFSTTSSSERHRLRLLSIRHRHAAARNDDGNESSAKPVCQDDKTRYSLVPLLLLLLLLILLLLILTLGSIAVVASATSVAAGRRVGLLVCARTHA